MRVAAIGALLWASIPLMASPQPGPMPEYQVKTLFLYNLGKFVDWPEGVLDGPDTPIRIGVIDKSRMATAFKLIEDETIAGHALEFRVISSARSAEGCQIVFLNGNDPRLIQLILFKTRGKPVLTVGEDPDFIAWGGIVRFRMEQSRVRLDLSPRHAKEAGLGLRAQLLQLCRIVDGHDKAHHSKGDQPSEAVTP